MKATKAISKLTLAALVCLATTNAQTMTMRELFDGVQAQGNVGSPAVIQGQTLNMYTGGSMFMRAPRRAYQVVAFTPPHVGAGCGGIDLFTGGFSHINEEQFVAMLRNIGSNALGYGFKLALQNLCPTCDNVIQALEATAKAMNRMSVDSCEAAKGIVQAALPESWDKEKTNSAKMFGVSGGFFDDAIQAWSKVGDDTIKKNEKIEQAKAADPARADVMPSGNIVWNALKRSVLPDAYKMILMSMTGTTVFPTGAGLATPTVYAAKEIDAKAFIGFNSNDLIKLPIWKCDEVVDCLNPTAEETAEMPSFRVLVREKLAMVADKIAARDPFDDPAAVWRFLSTTDLPVYKMLAVATSLGNTAIADSLMGRYQELIAAKYAEVYLETAVNDLRGAIARYKSAAGGAATKDLENNVEPRLSRLMAETRDLMRVLHQQTVTTYNVAQEVAHMERAMSANMSQTLKTSLAFGKGLR